MKIVGHRGAAGLAQENSLDAITKALKVGVDIIELDVRLQSGVAVLSHDPIQKQQVYTTLKHALNEVNGKVPLFIEIKEAKAISQTLKTLEKYEGDVTFSSFKFGILQEVRRNTSGSGKILYTPLRVEGLKYLHIQSMM
jgi:glycerophosphoryl diester phosphodiesterase